MPHRKGLLSKWPRLLGPNEERPAAARGENVIAHPSSEGELAKVFLFN